MSYENIDLSIAIAQLLAGSSKEEITELCAHDATEGAGTKATGYALPEMGPFKCANCIHVSESNDRCDHPDVIKDPDVPKENGKAVVHAESCCNYFHPKDKE